jgi:serine/threonine-protein kinase HipA
VGAAQLGELDYLLNSADDRAGALGFGLNQQPPAPRRKFNRRSNSQSFRRSPKR